MQLVKVFQCSQSDTMSTAYSEYMHFIVGTPNCFHYTMITYGYCHSKSKKEHTHWYIYMLSNCGHQENRQVDSLTEATAEAVAVTGTALPLHSPTSLNAKTGI